MDYHFADSLSRRDSKRHISHPFLVPAGATSVRIRLSFAPRLTDDVRNMLTLTLFDPDGFRGAGHRGGNLHEVEICADSATPGYAAGPLPAGEWNAQIDTHMIWGDAACTYQLDVIVSTDDGAEATPAEPVKPQFDQVANANVGWYRGDLHTHTRHSDGSWSVADLVAAARAHQLDFVTLTDHNTVSPLAEMERLAAPDLLTLGGMELTTFWGHAVCLGSGDWIDWRVDRRGDEMADIARQVYARDEIFIIAHPLDIGDPYCTGCRWLYPALMPGPARFVEVWNGLWGNSAASLEKNEGGLNLWYQWLNAGHRLVATAGSDVHGQGYYEKKPGFNVIYANELSRRGLFDGLRKGHLYLSSGPVLHLTAHTPDGRTAMMGDTLRAERDTPITVQAHWQEAPAHSTVRLVTVGQMADTISANASGCHTWTVPAQEINWCVLELRDEENHLQAVTNPIYVNA